MKSSLRKQAIQQWIDRDMLTHANVDTTFPLRSDARGQKIWGLTSCLCYEQRRHTLFWACKEQDTATLASLRVPRQKEKSSLQIQRLSTSVCLHQSRRWLQMRKPQTAWFTSTTRSRVEVLASDVFETLSLAVDDSIENSDVAQLCLYIMLSAESTWTNSFRGTLDRWDTTLEVYSSVRERLHQRLGHSVSRLLDFLQSFFCAKLCSELKETMDSEIVFVVPPAYSTAFSAHCCQTCQLSIMVGSSTMTLDGLAKEMHRNYFWTKGGDPDVSP